MTEHASKLSRLLTRSAIKRQISNGKHAANRTDHIYLQTWLIIAISCAFAAWVAFDNKIFHIMVETDKSYLSLAIIIVFLAASVHAAWQIAASATRINAANRYLDGNTDESFEPSDIPPSARTSVNLSDDGPTFIGSFLRDVKESHASAGKRSQERQNNYILEIYADQLRSPASRWTITRRRPDPIPSHINERRHGNCSVYSPGLIPDILRPRGRWRTR